MKKCNIHFWSSYDFHIFNTYISSTIRENIKQPYKTPGNVLIFIVFKLQMKIKIPNPLSSLVDEVYRCYIV
jgi:hypothetical protein